MKLASRICRLLFVVVAVGTLSASRHALAAETPRPNILWISVEDISPNLGCFGDADATTPNLDRLAQRGVRYVNAFSNAGVCAPSRSCIITGVFPTSLGSHHMRCRGMLPDGMKFFPEYLRQVGYYCTNNSKTDYNLPLPKGTWDASSGKAHWRNRPRKDQPFFAVFNLTTTHESRIENDARYQKAIANVPSDLLHDPAKLTLPPYYPDTPAVRRDWARYYNIITAMDRQVADILRQLQDDGLADNTIVIWFSDHGVGLPRAKRWLYDSGMRVPMIVYAPKRFERLLPGKPGESTDELVSFVDLAPTMLNLAGVAVPSYMQGRAFLGEHLSAPRKYVYGARDRMDERYDIIRAVRDERYKYIRNYEPHKPYYQFMNTPEKGGVMRELRRLHAEGKLPPAAELFMADHKPLEELYDLQNDPHEIHNLAGSPEHQAILQRLRAAHIAWVGRTLDVGLMPEPEINSLQRKTGRAIYTLTREGAGLPIARLRNVAALGERGVAARDDMVAALGDEDASIRYWGAIGLGNLGQDAAEAASALRKSLHDESPVVQIAAARALCLLGATGSALPVLEKQLQSEHPWVRLNAAIALDEIDERACPALPALRTALGDKENKYVVRVANRAINQLQRTHNQVP